MFKLYIIDPWVTRKHAPLSETKAPEIGKSEQEVRLPLLFQHCKYSLQVLSVSVQTEPTQPPPFFVFFVIKSCHLAFYCVHT